MKYDEIQPFSQAFFDASDSRLDEYDASQRFTLSFQGKVCMAVSAKRLSLLSIELRELMRLGLMQRYKQTLLDDLHRG